MPLSDKDTTPTPGSSTVAPPPGAKYRGAVVDDLQLPPAFCLPHEAPLAAALEAAYEREFDQLPVLSDRRKPIGYLNVPSLKEKYKRGEARDDDQLYRHTTHFPLASKSHPYTVITPDTPLEELEEFFRSKGTEFALVTDYQRKWVLAVATLTDLETFVKRRG
ncbi:uncharacterized protein MKK02DRAFT_44526 [Dioszegia hungarica]|uniref:CBS domain-containing protein n=1 Tax=Dioszegia hungarica TaxID=4972 RepID=A0AA38HAW4_9TREE|nr:uncharacterized protein MKK02DRAFT_44526 [Dioszegia hungarica]KAI9635831.1 hypothetical protein MKK02DRAFT_44526 [Dioszegia hungarica]